MQAARWVQDHIPGGELNRMRAIHVIDNQLATVVFVRLTQK